ncbi:MAG: type I restriction-modification system subunit M [Holosporales bacterium]|jgi:type I restriction enzyme M protein|nr:type I restriction-modification system subunit M [Holosporales bacterium]
MKIKKDVDEKSIESSLWDACDKLRGPIDPADYKNVVLPLVFLKFVNDLFTEQRQSLIEQGLEEYVDTSQAYTKDNVFFLPEQARWGFLIGNAKQNDLPEQIDHALQLIEQQNKELKGTFAQNYYSRLTIDTQKLASLLDEINNINTNRGGHDIIGRVYEYFLKHFALDEGKKRGQYYTPKYVVDLIVNMIEPYHGNVYDPCCGSGGMFIQSTQFIKEHHGDTNDIAVFGQEYNENTYRLAKMNFAIHAISANLGEYNASGTLLKDVHQNLKADFIMANPPFNQKDWRDKNQLLDDYRWQGYKTPSASNANYAWILHMVSKLSQNGVAGFLLANGALSGAGVEKEIRKQLVKNDLVEAICILPRNMFYTTDISVTLWILNRNKKDRKIYVGDEERDNRNRTNEVLFMDLRKIGEPFEKSFIQFSPKNIADISETFHNWRQGKNYEDIPEYCKSVSIEDIENNDYSLVASKYIEFNQIEDNASYATKMQTLSSELSELLAKEAICRAEVTKVMAELGFKIGGIK